MSHYDVFISSSSNDFGIAGEVYRFLRDHKLEVFFSEQSLLQRGSSDYRKVIDEAIEHTCHMVVVTSSRANVEGEWVQAEWGSFINEKRSGRKNGNLVTLLVGALSPADLPMSLRNLEVLPYSDEGLTKLLAYVTPAGTASIASPLGAGAIRTKKKQGTAAAFGLAGVLLVAVCAVVGWYFFYKPGETKLPVASSFTQGTQTSPPAAPQSQNPSPASDPLAKSPAAQEQPKQEIAGRKQEPATTRPERPAPTQPDIAASAPTAPATTAAASNPQDKQPPQPATSTQTPPSQVAEQTAAREQALSPQPSEPQKTAAPPRPANPPAPSSAAKATATVFINNPGINDRFVDKLLAQLRSGLSEKAQEAPAVSEAAYVLRWLEKPMFQREGPNGNGEYTFSISMRCEVYNQTNSQVVKSISVRDNQTGRNEQAASILDGLIAKSSANILNSLATLNQ